MTCKLCNSNNVRLAFTTLIRSTYYADFYKCDSCGLLYAADPFWLGEVYADDGISLFDVGHVQRNLTIASNVLLYITINASKTDRYVDYSAGYGLLVRLLRDRCLNFFWIDPYTPNLFAKGFEVNPTDHGFALCTAIECFEHFADPLRSIASMFSLSPSLFFTTELLPKPVPSADWWYYMFNRGGHVAFYEHKTMIYIARQYSSHYYDLGSFHLITRDPIPLFRLFLLKLALRFRLDKLLFLSQPSTGIASDFSRVQKQQSHG